MAEFETHPMPGRTGVVVAHGALAEVLRRDPQYTEVLGEEQVSGMKGAELDAALQARGLPTGGKVAARKARLLGQPEQDGEAAEVPDPGVLPPEPTPPAPPEQPNAVVPAAAASTALHDAAADRDAANAEPTTQAAALDRDAEHSKEN